MLLLFLLLTELSSNCFFLTKQDDVEETEGHAAVPGRISSSLSSRHCPSSRLKSLIDQSRSRPSYTQMLAERRRLPVYQHRDDILDAFRRHSVFIVAGETGSGKSTQVPQFILEVCGHMIWYMSI